MSDKKTGGRPRTRIAPDVRVTIRLRPGQDDAILERLARVPPGRRSAYIRRVLAGAPVEALDVALAQETERVASALDAMATLWEDEDDDKDLL